MSCLVHGIRQVTALQLPVDTPGRAPETGNLSGFLDVKAIKESKCVNIVFPVIYFTEFKRVVNYSPGLHLTHNIEVKPGEIYDLIKAYPA
jgi:hypothetical protein